jgi:protein-disulfide isomerase
MPFQTEAYDPAGPTSAVSVTASSSTAITISATSTNTISNFSLFYNSGATQVWVSMVASQPSSGAVTAPAAVLPVAGTPQPTQNQVVGIMLPANMTRPIVVATPNLPYALTAIGSGAGPSIIYITPLTDPQ